MTQRRPKAEIARRVDEALALVRLETQADKLPGQLSGGQQQRVAIARAIVVEPPLVLMDEPLSNLDAKLRLEMRAEIRRIHTMLGCSTIYVTHDQEEALSLADRIVVMIDGQMRQIGTPEELYARPAHADVAEFMGYRNLVAVDGDAGRKRRGGDDRRARAIIGTPIEAVGGEAVVAIRPDDLAAIAGRPDRGDGGDRRVPWPRLLCGCAWPATATELFFRADRRRLQPGETVRLDARRAMRVLVYRRMSAAHLSLRRRLRERGLDGVTLLVLPGVLFVLALFVYPFLYGLVLSFQPKEGGWLANYLTFFSDPFLYDTIWLTLQIAVPVTLLNIVLSVPVALRVRLMKRQKLLTTILVIPITLGTVMVAEGLLTYLGPRGWLNRVLLEFGIAD